METLKYQAYMVDAEGTLYDLRAKISYDEERQYRKCFSISSDNGQELDSIKPANENQEELVRVWKDFHLNDMRAGNERQRELLEAAGLSEASYMERKDYLCSVKYDGSKSGFTYEEGLAITKGNLDNVSKESLLEKLPAVFAIHEGKFVEYGSIWFYQDLPTVGDVTFEDRIQDLFDRLDDDYSSRNTFTEDDLANAQLVEHAESIGVPAEKLLAFCMFLEVDRSELELIEVNGNEFNMGRRYYLVCTDDEAQEEFLSYVGSLVDDIGFSAFNSPSGPDCEIDDFDGGINITMSVHVGGDERGSMLSSYDGEEHEIGVGEETYYIYKR